MNMMKQLLILLFVISGISHAQTWHSIGSPLGSGVVGSDMIIDDSTGTIYAAYIESSSQRTTVKKWNGSTWVLVGNANFGTGVNQYHVKLAVLNEVPYAAIRYFTGSAYQIEVYQLSGGVWTSVSGALQTISDGDFSLKSTVFNTVELLYFDYMFYSEVTLRVVSPFNNVEGTASFFNSSWYGWDFVVDSNGNTRIIRGQFDGQIVLEQPAGVNFSTLNTLWTGAMDANHIVCVSPAAGKINFGFSTSSDIYLGFIDNDFLTYSVPVTGYNTFDLDATVDQTFIYAKNSFWNSVFVIDNSSGMTYSLGDNINGSGIISDPLIEEWSGRLVVSYIDGGVLNVAEYNNQVSVTLGNALSGCEIVTVSSPVNQIHLEDNNYVQNSILLNVVSTNQLVIPDAQISVTGAFPDYQIQFVSLPVSSDVVVDLEITVLENGVQIYDQNLQVTVFNSTDITASSIQASFCENEPSVTLAGIASPPGGVWSGDGIIPGPKFDPQTAGPGSTDITYTFTNGQGCVSSYTQPITVYEIPSLSFSVSPSDCGVSNGEINMTVTGGLPPYSYLWSNGQTLQDLYGLLPGTYTTEVTDANGCEVTGTASTISSGFTLDADVTPVLCYGDANGTIDLLLDASDLALISNILWSNGATTQDISNLEAGTYEVVVTGTDNCQSIASYVVGSPSALQAASFSNNATCGLSDGATSCVITGGTTPYSYQWYSAPAMTPVGLNQSFVEDVAGGAYVLVTTDNNGCSLSTYNLVSEDGGPAVTVDSIENTVCSSTGAIYVTASSMSGIAGYSWLDGSTDEDRTGLDIGYYALEVTDNDGCSSWISAMVETGFVTPVPVCMVTVDTSTNTNLVVWEKPMATDIESFNIYRETATAGEYLLVGNVPYGDESVYNDLVASPSIRSWRYKVSVVNQCGVESDLSDFHKTIHLTISEGIGGAINLSWDAYEGFNFPWYEIYRYTNADGWVQIQQMPTTLFSFVDYPGTTDGLSYIAVVTPPQSCVSSLKVQDHNSSRSNKTAGLTGGGTNGVESGELVFSVYPNPVQDEVWVQVAGNLDENSVVRIYNAQGEAVRDIQLENTVTAVDLSGLGSGVYTVQLVTSTGVYTKQLVKQ